VTLITRVIESLIGSCGGIARFFNHSCEPQSELEARFPDAYLAFPHRHSVELLNALARILFDTLAEDVTGYDLSDVFAYEVITCRIQQHGEVVSKASLI
jgi:hypothetical protein